ncbi:MAG: hypothetical protein GY770_22520, partial [Aestuariibacter sp.]|nr:hypothetical protein [Aestuariibacter sp.]
LTQADGNNDWRITGVDRGTLTDITSGFGNIQRLTGGSGDDDFIFTLNGSLAGLISGGTATTIDSVNMSALANVSVTLEQDITGIEEITGNGANSTLIATDADNMWNISGENDGSVTGIAFIDFANLTGGSGIDVFDVDTVGKITGLVKGGANNDVANIALTGAETGSFSFDGEDDQDTINLTGGATFYDGQYNSNVGVYEQLEYTNGSNVYAVNYTQTETVNDNLTSAKLTI